MDHHGFCILSWVDFRCFQLSLHSNQSTAGSTRSHDLSHSPTSWVSKPLEGGLLAHAQKPRVSRKLLRIKKNVIRGTLIQKTIYEYHRLPKLPKHSNRTRHALGPSTVARPRQCRFEPRTGSGYLDVRLLLVVLWKWSLAYTLLVFIMSFFDPSETGLQNMFERNSDMT